MSVAFRELERRVKCSFIFEPCLPRTAKDFANQRRRHNLKSTGLTVGKVVMSREVSIQDIHGNRISGQYEVKDGMVTVTASDGRTTTGVLEDSMLTVETLAKTLLLQLHRTDGEADP
jgi:hypothetical protein